MALASDDRDPEAGLWVEFSRVPVEMEYQSKMEGRPIWEERDFITIRVPGDQFNVIYRPVTQADKDRFPKQWARYENSHSNTGVSGTLIEQWPAISRAMAENLRGLGFKTVEQIAESSDQNINKIGMLVGMPPLTFREKAKAYLSAAAGTAEATAAAQERDQLRQELADMKTLIAQMAQQQTVVRPPSKIGRPRKQVAQGA